MKYLITARQRRSVPPEQAVSLFQAAREWLSAQLADGRLDCNYVFADTSGGCGILNADSHEEAFDTLLAHPLNPFFDWEIKALCDWGHGIDKVIEFYQKRIG